MTCNASLSASTRHSWARLSSLLTLLAPIEGGDLGTPGLPLPSAGGSTPSLPEFLSLRFLKTETMTSRLPKMSTTVVKISTLERADTTQAGRGEPAASSSRSAEPKRPLPPGSQQFLREPFSSIAAARRAEPPPAPCRPPSTDWAGGGAARLLTAAPRARPRPAPPLTGLGAGGGRALR